jgi:heme O synthase-like polyprenyltransferase
MAILRLFVALVALVLVLSIGMYLLKRDARYLKFARQVFQLSIYVLLAFALLSLLERYVLSGWGVLL